jgi:hypothetical protein
MKKKFILALAVMAALSLPACQATPTQPIVKEKNLDKMIEEATKTQEPSAQSNAAQTAAGGDAQGSAAPDTQINALAARMGAPGTWRKELVDAKGKVKIHVDAQVIVPDASKVAVQRVEQAKITQEQVDALVSRLMKGDIFSGNDYKLSKNDIQTKILQVQAAIAKGDDASSISPKLGGKYTDYMQMQLEQLQKDLQAAPEQSVKTPVTSKFTPIDPDDGGGEELYALSQPATDMYQSFRVYNYNDGTSFLRFSSEKNAFSQSSSYFSSKESIEASLNQGRHGGMTQEELDAITDVQISKEDAKNTADEIVAALGLNGLVCVSEDKLYGGSYDMTADQSAYLNPRRCVWFLRYARAVNGVPVTYTVYDCMKVETNSQSAPWAYEDMTIAIDDGGVVYFNWGSPYNVTGTVTDDSNILSFEDVTNIFDTMALVVNAWDGIAEGSPNLQAVDIKIDRIQFGLTRVTEQNKRNSGLLVPCWDFIGTMTYISTVNGQTQTMDDGPIPLLTVNAIDGTVINRSLGY